MDETGTIRRVRTMLLATLLVGMAGTTAELLLIGHVEGISQRIPLSLLTAGLAVAAWHAWRPRALTTRLLQSLMIAFVAGGALGVGLHYDGNVEFEREMYPDMAGVELVRNTLTGATPVLAPGSMTLLGLVGLAHVYRHPSLVHRTGGAPASEELS
jgi:hypothetical protein